MNRAPTELAAAERRAEFRALARDPRYEPRATWRCAICEDVNLASSTRCSTCGSQGPSWMPPRPRQANRPPAPIIVRVDHRQERGTVLVELALATPVLLLLLLGVLGAGILFLGAVQQASASNTIAAWAGEHADATEDEREAYSSTVTSCDVDTVYGEDLVTVSITCPTIAGRIAPALPTTITTTATAFVPSETPSPAPPASPSPTP
jgi:hypothetical protein